MSWQQQLRRVLNEKKLHDLLEKHGHSWTSIFHNEKNLTFDFLLMFRNKVDWKKAFECRQFTTYELDRIAQTPTNIPWQHLCFFQKLSQEFMEKHQDSLAWDFVIEKQNPTEELISKNVKHLGRNQWDFMENNRVLSEEFMRKYQDKFDWNNLSATQEYSLNFVEEFKDKINWYCAIRKIQMPDSFLRKYEKYLAWESVSRYQDLNLKFVDDFNGSLYWFDLSQNQHIKIDVIRKYEDRIDFNCVCKSARNLSMQDFEEFKDKWHYNYMAAYQKLSEEFMRKYKDDFEWQYLSEFQEMSESFIEEMEDYVCWTKIFAYQILSNDFREKYKHKI